MNYDAEKISWIVEAKRTAFWRRAACLLALMAAGLVIAIIGITDYLTVLCSLLEFPLMFLLFRLIRKYNADILLKGEIKGRNIKEYEYAVQTGTRTPIHRKLTVAQTFANRRASPLRLNGTVYLELEDGSITSISGLYKSHMDIYEDGDILLKYAGTKFPVVISRDVKKQPCPICGEVNDESRDECRTCGLSIIRKH